MVRHIILWQLKDELTAEEKRTVCENMKRELEGLVGTVEGLQSLTVHIDGLATSNADAMLESTLTDAAALAAYAVHPAHVAAANAFVRPFVKTRLCLDF
ncbi:MAG: Dabb family protein [Ruminococcaceae bacterium]|nr:Dabb family protein [Oscillospiraceae bacterium]